MFVRIGEEKRRQPSYPAGGEKECIIFASLSPWVEGLKGPHGSFLLGRGEENKRGRELGAHELRVISTPKTKRRRRDDQDSWGKRA